MNLSNKKDEHGLYKFLGILLIMIMVFMTCSLGVYAAGIKKPGTVTMKSTENKASGVKLCWKKVAGATSYQIARRSAAGKSYKILGSTKNTSFTDKTAKSGKKYIYRVRAVKTVKKKKYYGAYSKCKSQLYLSRVEGVILSASSSHYSARWKAVTGAEAYEVQYALNPDFSDAITEIVNNANDGLTREISNNSSVYHIRIRAMKKVNDKTVYGPYSIPVASYIGTAIVLKKPVIYLYPEEEMKVSVALGLAGEVTCVYPKFTEDQTWKVTAAPDGTLSADGKTYNYLYWEGNADLQPAMTNADCVAGADTAFYLENALARLGMNEKESNDFITFWLPILEKNPYNVIEFQKETYTDLAPLDISPTPDTLIRVYMCYRPSEEMVDCEATFEETPVRNGFTVVEWGGSEV